MSLRTVLKPVNVVFGALGGIGSISDARIVKYYFNSDFGKHLVRAKDSGEDLATTTYGKWVVMSVATIPDRFVGLFKELAKVPAGSMFWTWSFGDFMLVLNYFISLCATYLAFKMIGRQSFVALVDTKSIFFNSDVKIETDAKRAHHLKGATDWAAGFTDLIKLV